MKLVVKFCFHFGRTHFLSLMQSHEEIRKPYCALGHIEGEGLCADIHTNEFPPSRLAYWASTRQNISKFSKRIPTLNTPDQSQT